MTLLQRDRENIELGREEGREEGFQKGQQAGVKIAFDIIRLYQSGKGAAEIAGQLGLEADYVRQILEDYEKSQE